MVLTNSPEPSSKPVGIDVRRQTSRCQGTGCCHQHRLRRNDGVDANFPDFSIGHDVILLAWENKASCLQPEGNFLMRRVLLLIRVIVSGLAASFLLSNAAWAELVVMQGPVTMRTASLWVQADEPGQVGIEYRADKQASQLRQTDPVSLSAQQDYSAKLNLTDLMPGETYLYRVLQDGRPVRDGRFSTMPAWRSSGRPFDFTVYFGTCAFLQDSTWDWGPSYGGEYEIFDHIAAQALDHPQPSFMLWGGDTVYYREADYESPWGMNARQRAVRHHSALQKLLTALPHYAIWDDHDYGPNDSNRSFVFKDASLVLFQRYWANPSYGLP